VIILSLFIISSLAISFETMAPTASAQTTTVVRRHRRHKRSFWQRHRDKLTVAGGAGAGALIGAGVGSKKAAAIGAGAGAGAAALYTYKIRKRHRRVRRY
jgi:hypothetical protein